MGLLDGKTAIITGSARGIGRATAELFAAEGAQVTINDIDGDIAEQAAGEIQGETIAVSGDLTKPGACDDRRPEDRRRLREGRHPRQQRRLHLGRRRAPDERRAVPGDARHPCRGAVPHAAARSRPTCATRRRRSATRGEEVFRKIINITSISGTMGNAGQANYSSGKAAVTGLTKTLAKEWGQFKINVNAVAFGFVETRLTQAKEKGETVKAGEGGPEVSIGVPEQMRNLAAAIIPLGRPAQPEEAAGPVLFLASPLANYIHGQVIPVTGGQFGGMYSSSKGPSRCSKPDSRHSSAALSRSSRPAWATLARACGRGRQRRRASGCSAA